MGGTVLDYVRHALGFSMQTENEERKKEREEKKGKKTGETRRRNPMWD